MERGCGVEMLGSLGRFPLTGHGCASRGSSLDAALCSLANERGLKKMLTAKGRLLLIKLTKCLFFSLSPPPHTVLSSRQSVGVPGLGGGGHGYCRGPWPHAAHQPGSGCPLQKKALETGLHWVRAAGFQRRAGEKKSGKAP